MARRFVQTTGFKNFSSQRMQPESVWIDLLFMMIGMLMAFVLCVMLFEWFRNMGLINVTADKMHLAADKTYMVTQPGVPVNIKPQKNETLSATEKALSATEQAGPFDATIFINGGKNYGYLGQKDVSLLKIELVANKDAKLQELVFDHDGFASPTDLVDLQLYLDGKFIGTTPFFEAKGKFENLKLDVAAEKKYVLEVKGTISENAYSGDRLQIGLKDASSVKLVDADLNRLKVKAAWPLWSGYVSVIGQKIR